MAKVEFVSPQGEVLIPATDYPSPTHPGDKIEFFGKLFEIVDVPQVTRRVMTSIGQQCVRTVTVTTGAAGNKPRKHDKGSGRGAKSVVMESA